jgi:hypothetical protein
MRARYTAKDQKPVDVEVREFVERSMKEESGIDLRPPPFDRDKVAAMLARLVEVLAEKDALSGGEVLAVLGFSDGQLELDDGTPRTDAEWRDYWADRDAAFGKEREATPTAATFEIGDRVRYAGSVSDRRGTVEGGRHVVQVRWDDAAVPTLVQRSSLEKATPAAAVELGEVKFEALDPNCTDLVRALGLDAVEREVTWPELIAAVAELNRKCAERGELIDAIRSEIEDCEDARDAVTSIAARLGVSVKP